MRRLAGLYGVNAVAYLANMAAIVVFLSLTGRAGYGAYGVYIVFLAFYQVLDFALVKVALIIFERHQTSSGADAASARAVGFMNVALVFIAVLSVPFVLAGNTIFPHDRATDVGGSMVAAIVAGEFIGSGAQIGSALESASLDAQLPR